VARADHSLKTRTARFVAASILLGSLACRTESSMRHESAGRLSRHERINDDRRQEVSQIDGPNRAVLARAAAAVVFANHVLFKGRSVEIRAPSLGQARNLCDGERFAEQLALAMCSGVLIDDDLVVTAGHCMGGDEEAAAAICRQIRVVFDYQLKDGDKPTVLDPKSVFSCRRVVLLRHDGDDFAVLQLDRPATPRWAPLPLAPTRVSQGESVIAAAHGMGLPLKVERDVQVESAPARQPFFLAATSTFAGASGGGIVNSKLQLVGLIVRGQADWITENGCTRAAHGRATAEQHQHILPVANALCMARWPSPRLCGSRPACGDGVCSATESSASCPRDCPGVRCGDGVCELSERATCDSDCHRYDQVPATWEDRPELYLSRRETRRETRTKGSIREQRREGRPIGQPVAPSSVDGHPGAKHLAD